MIGFAALLLYAGVGRDCTMCEGSEVIGLIEVMSLPHDLKLVHLCYHSCPFCHGSGLQPAGRRDVGEGGGMR